MTINSVPLPPNVDMKKQSVAVPGSKRPGQTAVLRDPVWGSQKLGGVIPCEVLTDIWDSGHSKGPTRPLFGIRPIVSTKPLTYANEYVWETYEEVGIHRKKIGSALHTFFKSGKFGTGREFETVGIWSINRPEWQYVDLACQAYGKVSVSLYDTLGPDACEYIINHAEIPVVFATREHVTTLLGIASRTPSVKMVVSIDPLDDQNKQIYAAWGKEKGIDILDLREFEAYGNKNLTEPIRSSPSTVATICYTSGTTNVPKGVVLTHGNLARAAVSNLHAADWVEGGSIFSYLPLAHIYERFAELFVMAIGGRIGYFTGDPLRLIEDTQILKPYLFPSVPRVLNRLYMAAMQSAKAPGVKGALFRKALDVKLNQLKATGDVTHRLWDALVFKKVQAVLGGKVGLITSGSAPISMDTMNFLKVAFACPVIEGYGLTETCGTCCRTWKNDPSATTTIGGPQPVNEVKLIDVPAMNYTSEDKPNPRGEILIRGLNVFSRYHKDEKNTREALDDEGWFHTGDVAEIDSYGRLRIIDRIKNIMKLAQGEYVALEKVENVYTACPIIAQVYIHGDSLRDHLLAVVVPDPLSLSQVVAKDGIKLDPTDATAVAEAIKNPAVIKAALAQMNATAKKAGLKGFEMAKSVHLTMEPFSVENGLLTPTFKVRRKDASAKYKEVLDALYNTTTTTS